MAVSLAVIAFAVVPLVDHGVSAGASGAGFPRALAGMAIPGAYTAASGAVSARCLVGENPEQVAYDPIDHYVYVADNGPGGGLDGAITILQSPCHVVATIPLSYASATPFGVAYEPSVHEVLVSENNYGQVFVLAGTTIKNVLSGLCSPGMMTWDAQAKAMLIADGCGYVDAIFGDTSLGVDSGAISVCNAAAVLDAAGYIWVADQCAPYQVSLYDPETFAYIGAFTISTPPEALAYDPVDGTVLVGSAFSSVMHVLYPSTVALHTYLNTTFSLGKLLGAGDIIYSPATHDMYVSGRAGSDVWKITSAGKFQSVFLGTDATPQFMAYDPATQDIYVTGWSTDTVYVIH